ncbi:hypothetical protein ASPACDRAFT_1854168 [Aspergillus aculeatus ATCC 16872]|uniref:F-box domain-containing protein n=1 Tax=Aspergillus aculeatus (strain ATCC 16872 / CBS 172.66 / WB 5094) TaxID=690307 RepID=A0A1L9X117_ASPA1|nr:uncharacterized protein ASPACDRAFT_1854168 [Aspergillus aculeatus ATCC 16872]OJK02180.1 hypothetical protein ASPACDRAFT_1854168 [Aspergillus aculeatus ATCC 16872]
MQLLQLPTEILRVIISQIDSRASLARLARVCRFLEALVDPFLYQSVYLRNHDGEIFIRAVELRPARAQYIRELLIHYHYVNVPNQQEYYPLLVESLVPTICRLVNLRRLTVKGLLYDAPQDYDDPDLGNVERFDAYAAEWFRLFEHAGGADVLPSLESCQMIMDDVPYDPEIRTELWSFDTRSAVMVHPHLRNLTLVGALVGGLDPALQYEPRSTRLESLTLLCCDVSSDGLRELLRVPEALKHLTWKGVPATAPPEFWPGDRQSYVDAIRTHAASLLSLDLDFYAIGGHHPPLDFRHFRGLRQLTIDPGVLRGRGDSTDAHGNARHSTECLLPGSLQRLVLREYREYSVPDQETLPLVYRWVSSGALPSLRSVTVQSAKFSRSEILHRALNAKMCFDDAFQSVGVQLEYEKVRSSLAEEQFGFDCHCCTYALRWNNGLDY